MKKFAVLFLFLILVLGYGLLLTSGPDTASSLPMIESYEAALASGDINAALSLFDNDALLSIHAGPLVSASGIDAIAAWMTSAMDDGLTTIHRSEPIVEDNKIFWRGTLARNSWRERNVDALEGSWEVIVIEGRITSLKFTLTPQSLITLEAAGFGTSASETDTIAGTFAGFVPGTDGILAIVTDGITFTAYLCDGALDQPTILADWFRGTIANNSVNLTLESGAKISADLTETEATGTLTLADGTALPFNVPLVSGQGDAGLYHAEVEIEGVSYVLGWAKLPDGQVRGAAGFTASSGSREHIGLNYVEQDNLVVPLIPGGISVVPRQVGY